nr:MAG TPA: hypothetical protein [Caudoviricetes sp.]DAR92070.1 MAG TPA: hypothetical protein [Caudoviricetes sp.]
MWLKTGKINRFLFLGHYYLIKYHGVVLVLYSTKHSFYGNKKPVQ